MSIPYLRSRIKIPLTINAAPISSFTNPDPVLIHEAIYVQLDNSYKCLK